MDNAPTWKPGDVVNGHRLNDAGTNWEPVPPAPKKRSGKATTLWVGLTILGLTILGQVYLPSSDPAEPSMSDLSCFQLNSDLDAIRYRNTAGGFVKSMAEWEPGDVAYWQDVMAEITERQNRGEDCELS